MPRQSIQSPQAPAPIGPYVQAVKAGDFIFVSGQLPVDPLTGTLVRAGVRAQTRRALDNLKAVLEAGGATLAHVVRVTIYLKDIEDFAQVNEVYAEFFPQNPPARVTVGVARLPKDAALELDAIAYTGS
jgi:2-iminobutanoate/2-iminopropanoate deaminase